MHFRILIKLVATSAILSTTHQQLYEPGFNIIFLATNIFKQKKMSLVEIGTNTYQKYLRFVITYMMCAKISQRYCNPFNPVICHGFSN